MSHCNIKLLRIEAKLIEIEGKLDALTAGVRQNLKSVDTPYTLRSVQVVQGDSGE